MREQLAAAVAADGQQRRAGRHQRVLPEVGSVLVDVAGRGHAAGAPPPARSAATREVREQRGLAVAEMRAQLGDVRGGWSRGAVRTDAGASASRTARRWRATAGDGGGSGAARLVTNAGGGGLPADSVITS